jgi:hypothetical protein
MSTPSRSYAVRDAGSPSRLGKVYKTYPYTLDALTGYARAPGAGSAVITARQIVSSAGLNWRTPSVLGPTITADIARQAPRSANYSAWRGKWWLLAADRRLSTVRAIGGALL